MTATDVRVEDLGCAEVDLAVIGWNLCLAVVVVVVVVVVLGVVVVVVVVVIVVTT